MKLRLMKIRVLRLRGSTFGLGILTLWLTLLAPFAALAQSPPYERVFPQSKATIERVLKSMQPNLAGRLPLLDGFAQPGEHPLDHYQRGYYQATVQVTATAAGGSLVHVSTKLTAWYSDSVASRSGYQLLTSNGRIESDLLDQLSEQLATVPMKTGATPPVAPAPQQSPEPSEVEPTISAPSPKFPNTDQTFPSSLKEGLSPHQNANPPASAQLADEQSNAQLQAQAQSLEDVLKNQAHPKNLVAVKASGTPVVESPSITAKPLFLASMHDEFELLNFNTDWVHVRISGLSRGWIWRNSVEMPDGIPDVATSASAAQTPAADLFHVIREETAPFPGDWEPLRNKNVKIITVQKIDENAKNAGPKERLEYAKFLLEKNSPELQQKQKELAGLVVIFDSSDGGMIAATLATLQQWRAGTLSDSALWHRCLFDPPEIFDSSGPSSASQ